MALEAFDSLASRAAAAQGCSIEALSKSFASLWPAVGFRVQY
jgi:hypothetical protein